MSASDEFPRGWQLQASGNGSVSLTVPASPGVTHVLTGIEATALETGAAGNYNGSVQVNGADFANGSLSQAMNVPAGAYTQLPASWQGVYLSTPGAALTVAMNWPGISNGYLTIKGYDI